MFEWTAPLFARFAHRWTDGELDALEEWLGPVARRGAVLDVGGGTGALAAALADRLGARVTVIDPSERMLSYVPDRPDVTTRVGRAEALPFDTGSFDAVVSTDALHHVASPEAAIAEMARVLRPSGRVAVLEIHRRGLVHVLGLVERLLGEPAAFFTPDELRRSFHQAGVPGRVEAGRGPIFTFQGERPAGE